MTLVDIFRDQIIDPFRIGMVIMLLVTAARTSGAAGTLVPIGLGIVFIAVLIPTTMGDGLDTMREIAVGLVVNAILVGLALGAKLLFQRLTSPKS